MNCPLCEYAFDLYEHRPKRIDCGHTFCQYCLEKIHSEKFIIYCPNDNIQDIRGLDEVPDNQLIVNQIERKYLHCYDHDEAANSFRLARLKPLCTSCQTIQGDLSESSYISTIPNKLFLVYMKKKKHLSEEIKQIVVGNPSTSLQSAVKMLQLITNYCTSRNACANHNLRPATHIDCNTYELQCEECKNLKAVKNHFPISSQTLSDIKQSYDKQCIYSLAAKNLSKSELDPSFTSKFFIELVLMSNPDLKKIENIGCQSCGKLYHLGARMPIVLSCNHIICYKCYSSGPTVKCCICKHICDKISMTPVVSLYKPPICMYCQNSTIGLNFNRSVSSKNLPYHNYCNCIVCTQCMRNGLHCNNCIPDVAIKQDYYQKLHMRSLKALLYFELPSLCELCLMQPAVFCSTISFNAICQRCNSGSDDIIELRDLLGLDRHLLELSTNPKLFEEGRPSFFKDYISLPINMKRKIQCTLYHNNPSYTPNPYGRILILRRFTTVYPITISDPRVFKVTKEFSNLTCTMDKPVKIVGVILAGRKDLQRMSSTIIYTSDGSTRLENQIEIASKEDIVFLDNLFPSAYFSIFVRYPVGEHVFSGKANRRTQMQHEGNIFDFSLTPDFSVTPGNDDRHSGPILGLLYTFDF